MPYEEATARCHLDVNLDELLGNYRRAQAELRSGALLIPVLKADAYGFGATAIARCLWQVGARLFAVAALNEAEELLRALPDADVLVMGMIGESLFPRALRLGVIFTLYDEAQAENLMRSARALGVTARVHAKLETGLHRLGFAPESIVPTLSRLAQSGVVRVEGLFTHMALRDAASDARQIALLKECAAELHAAGINGFLLHALDSIGMVRYPEDQMDAVRVGAWLYGVCPYKYEHPERCRAIGELKARVARLDWVPAGECIGYDDEHPLARDSRIATISAGYADGYARLRGVGQVEIRGRRCPLAGLVCMDQMMADVSGVPDVSVGDEVTLIGGGISVDEYAAWGGLNRNEAWARISGRVQRVYRRDGRVAAIYDESCTRDEGYSEAKE